MGNKLNEDQKEEIRNEAFEAAFKANDANEISYTTEKLIASAVEAAISKTEEILITVFALKKYHDGVDRV